MFGKMSHFDACNFMLFNFAARAPVLPKSPLSSDGGKCGKPFLRHRKNSLIWCKLLTWCHCVRSGQDTGAAETEVHSQVCPQSAIVL